MELPMKVKIVSAVCSVAVVLSAFAAVYLLPSGRSLFAVSRGSAITVVQSASADRTNSAESSNSANTAGYTVKAYNGKIGVFIGDSTTPDQVIDVNPDTLPQSEAERLNQGIHVDTHDGLLTILENYTS